MESKLRRTRIADVAIEAGVSKTAVSFAFNNPERLSPATAARIREAANALGYRPRVTAAHTARGGADGSIAAAPTMTIALLTPQVLSVVFANPFYAELCAGVAAVTDQAGYGLLFVSPLHGSLVRAIHHTTVDGFVAVGLSEDHPEVEQIRRAGMPMVLIDGGALPEHGSVESNDEVGARSAARHIVGLGHKDIVVVGMEPPNMPGLLEYSLAPTEAVASRRLAGYRQGLELGGVKLADDHTVVGPATFEGGVAAFRRIWEDGLRPTAVLAMSDVMAIGVIWAVREVGMRVPEDVSVVGFDDADVAARSSPPLTTVHQPIRQKGEEAARLLLRMISRPDIERPQHTILETRLIIRASTAAPPNLTAPSDRATVPASRPVAPASRPVAPAYSRPAAPSSRPAASGKRPPATPPGRAR